MHNPIPLVSGCRGLLSLNRMMFLGQFPSSILSFPYPSAISHNALASSFTSSLSRPMLISTPSLLLVLAVCSTNFAYPVSEIDVEGAVTSDEIILIDVGLVCRNMDGKDVGTGQAGAWILEIRGSCSDDKSHHASNAARS